MNIYVNPTENEIEDICIRPLITQDAILPQVKRIIENVKQEKDAALYVYAKEFDGVRLSSLKYIVSSSVTLPKDLEVAIKVAKENIERFHHAQKEEKQVIETSEGVFCWRESRAIERVGLYIPGGSAPLFSTLLMLAIPAQLAGCSSIVICTPPNKDGRIAPEIEYVASLLGIAEIYLAGGAQAIAAMSYGTETLPKVDKIFGPGNQYVTVAKQLLSTKVAIDMPAGPSEVLIIADDKALPECVAADLLSQAEHGVDSQSVLICTSNSFLNDVLQEVERQVTTLSREDITRKALKNCKGVVVSSMEEAFNISNRYAPEHLILSVENAERYIPFVTNAGSVFLGYFSCESAGDYASGTNHTLPTNGYATSYSGVSLDSFVKKITFQNVTKQGVNSLAKTVETMALAEGLDAHASAMQLRRENMERIYDSKPSKETRFASFTPYSSARQESSLQNALLLDANENPFDITSLELNRYPDPYQNELKSELAELKKVEVNQIFLGNGSDEIIDLLIRFYCEPKKDSIITCTPSFGMYRVSASLNQIKTIEVELDENFQLDTRKLLNACERSTQLMFLCSPNNPTGNSIPKSDLKYIIESFSGIVVVDEAYIDFSPESSLTEWIDTYENLVVLQTFSKGLGLAGARVGMAFSNEKNISNLNKIKAPYNVNSLTQKAALNALEKRSRMSYYIQNIASEKKRLAIELRSLSIVENIYPSDANFLLVTFTNSENAYRKCLENQIVVRKIKLVPNALRISVGTEEENTQLLTALRTLDNPLYQEKLA